MKRQSQHLPTINSNVLIVNKNQETPGKYFSKEDEVWDRDYL